MSAICGEFLKTGSWLDFSSQDWQDVRIFFWQIIKLLVFQSSDLVWWLFQGKLFRRLPTQPLPMPMAPTALIFCFSKKTNLVALIWSNLDLIRIWSDLIQWRVSDLRAGEGGRSLWRQLNNKKWAARNFGSAAILKVDEDGGIGRISQARKSLRDNDNDRGRFANFNLE